MIEIKFRVWNGEAMVSPDYITRDGYAHWKEDSIPRSSNDLLQYTGLKDKNGEEIYKGDIVKTEDGIVFAVEWVESTPGPGMRDIAGMEVPMFCDKSEIIGNIYKNPELVE
jgi:hypothetical protein